jgi:hypothetical protein
VGSNLSPLRFSGARKPQRQRGSSLSPPASGIARPLQAAIDDLGQKTFVVDRFPPKANLVKLRGNFLVASVIECLGEAAALIRKAGIDPTQFSCDPDGQPVCGTRVRDLWRTHSTGAISAGRFHKAARAQRHARGAGRGRDKKRADAGGQPRARSFITPHSPWRDRSRLVGAGAAGRRECRPLTGAGLIAALRSD